MAELGWSVRALRGGCLGAQFLDECRVALLEGLLNERSHEDVATNVDILADVEAGTWCAEAEFLPFGRLARQGAADGPPTPNVEAHGGVAMCLQAVGQIMEGAGIGDVGRSSRNSGKIRNLIGERVPDAMLLIGGRVGRDGNGMPLLDKGVEIDHLQMVVKEADDRFARDVGWKRSDGCKGCSFRHAGRATALAGNQVLACEESGQNLERDLKNRALRDGVRKRGNKAKMRTKNERKRP